MIEIWFFIAFLLSPGMVISPTQQVEVAYIEGFTSAEECEERRAMAYELANGYRHEIEMLSVVSPGCISVVMRDNKETEDI